jgi:hypothetical protein
MKTKIHHYLHNKYINASCIATNGISLSFYKIKLKFVYTKDVQRENIYCIQINIY